MMRCAQRVLILMLLFALLPVAGWARNEIFIEDQPNVATPENLEEPEPWKEGKADLPPFPVDENLIEFEVDDPSKPFRYYLDRNSLSIGEDWVVRYTLVIEAKRGVRNIFYEGIRCDTNEYKTYAFGIKNELKAARNSQWREMRGNHQTPYRYALHAYYLCEPESHRPRTLEAILEGLTSQRPEDFINHRLN